MQRSHPLTTACVKGQIHSGHRLQSSVTNHRQVFGPELRPSVVAASICLPVPAFQSVQPGMNGRWEHQGRSVLNLLGGVRVRAGLHGGAGPRQYVG